MKASPASTRWPYDGWNDQLSGAPNKDRLVLAPGSGEDTINGLNRGNAVSPAARSAERDPVEVWVYPGIL